LHLRRSRLLLLGFSGSLRLLRGLVRGRSCLFLGLWLTLGLL
jgi:hypothetical protein